MPREDPETYICPMEITLSECNESDEEWMVGKIIADELFIGAAEREGQPLWQVYDSDEWADYFPALYAEDSEDFADELMISGHVESLVCIYRMFLAPCLDKHLSMVLCEVLLAFPPETLFLVTEHVQLPDEVYINNGFCKLAGEPARLRYNGQQSPMSRYTPAMRCYFADPERTDESAVMAMYLEYRREHPSTFYEPSGELDEEE